jgi:hypothetical protein
MGTTRHCLLVPSASKWSQIATLMKVCDITRHLTHWRRRHQHRQVCTYYVTLVVVVTYWCRCLGSLKMMACAFCALPADELPSSSEMDNIRRHCLTLHPTTLSLSTSSIISSSSSLVSPALSLFFPGHWPSNN